MTVYLEKVTLKFPHFASEFTSRLAALLDLFGYNENHILRLTNSNQQFYPELQVNFQAGCSEVVADFTLSDGKSIHAKVENSTGLNKQSPHSYQLLSVETVNQRLMTSGISMVGLDHVGINLPWFASELHPKIIQLREALSARCLYHRFPTGEPWDFIIPGDIDEIGKQKTIDYSIVRRPKLELVSFDKTSTPLVQFDIGVNVGYESFSGSFPESLHDSKLNNTWVYLETPYSVDVCLVMNEFSESDWSEFFSGCRL